MVRMIKTGLNSNPSTGGPGNKLNSRLGSNIIFPGGVELQKKSNNNSKAKQLKANANAAALKAAQLNQSKMNPVMNNPPAQQTGGRYR